MFERVLVGVDGESGGRDAIALARRLTETGGELLLANVHNDVPNRYAPLLATIELEQQSRDLLERERAAAGVECEIEPVLATSPGRGLHVLAEHRHADLIVVGSSERTRLGRVTIGDDTRESLNGAPCAVAIARRGYGERPVELERVGVGYDGSPEAEAALAAAHAVAERASGRVRVLRTVALPSLALIAPAGESVGDLMDTIVRDADEQLGELPKVESEAVYGLPEEELTRLSEEVDLLVLGSRGYGPAKRMMFGSVSNYMQRHARCSLLVLPRAAVVGAAHAEAGKAARPEAAEAAHAEPGVREMSESHTIGEKR